MKKVIISFLSFLISISLLGQSDEERGHIPNSGLFLSMSLGPSYLSINDDISGGTYDNMTFKGLGIVFDIKLGAPIRENIVLHGDLIGINSGSVDVTFDGESMGTLDGENSIGMMMFGGGLTYYIMPQNIFISGTLGMGGFTITTGEETGNTQKGFGFYAKLGKEWYISKNWDLGFCFNFNYTNVNNEAGSMTEKLSGLSVGVGFNATFN